MTNDMTMGSPTKHILGFSIPLLFGFLFQQFYSVVDTIIVGKFLGVKALASVGATGSINFLIIGFCMGVCSGFSIPVSHKFGAKDFVGLRKYVANAVWLSIILAIIMTIVTVVFCRPILIMMKTPADIIDNSYRFIVIIFIGIPLTILYNLLAGIIRSLGDSKTPVIFLTIASLLNVGLDFLFILVFHMGVAGAGCATVISQGVSGICCLIFIIRKFEVLHIKKEEWKPDSHYLYNLCGMGIPMGLQYSITAIGSVILQSSVNVLGSLSVASVTAGSKISLFFVAPFDALGSTMATYGGQNVGANKLERVHSGVKVSIGLASIYAVLAIILLYLFSDKLALLFVDADQIQILKNIRMFLIFNSLSYILLALVNIIRFVIQGMGFSKMAILAGVCEMIARTVVAFLLVPRFGFEGVCMANPLAWIAADLFLIPAYFYVIRKLKKMFQRSASLV